MALEKIKKKTVGQRFRRLVLGKEKPNLLTRVSVISGFVIWLYLFSWQLLTFVSLFMYKNLDNSVDIRATYNKVGEPYRGDIINLLFIHCVLQIILYLAILFSLILIWRKRKIGFLVYVVASLATLFISFIQMGPHYMVHEIPLLDYILILSSTLYFAIGIFIFYRKRREEES